MQNVKYNVKRPWMRSKSTSKTQNNTGVCSKTRHILKVKKGNLEESVSTQKQTRAARVAPLKKPSAVKTLDSMPALPRSVATV